VLQALRLGVAALGALMVAIGILGPASIGQPVWSGMYFILIGAGAIAISILETPRYFPGRNSSGGGRLRPTDERFVDPTTGQRIRVWVDPASGERSYMPEGEAPPKDSPPK
jgi:hypothetical protein